MFLGGLTMYALLTAVPLTSAAALFGAMAWMLNSFMLGWMALEHFVVIEAWLPLAVLLVQKALQHRSWPISIALGAVLALVFLGGHPLYVQISLAAWGGYAAYLLLSRWRGRLQNAPTLLRIRSSMTDGAIVIVAVLILAGLVAVQALPNLALALSQGRSPLSYDQLMTFRMSASQLIYFFLPPPVAVGGRYDPYYETILQDSVLEVQRGMLFSGTPTALLAILGLVQRHPLARYAAGLAVVSLGVALGTPIAWAAYHLLPGFSYFKPLSRDLFLFNFSAAILAAFGADFVLRRVSCPPNWPRLPLLALGLRPGIAVLATLVVILQMHHLGTRVIRFQPSDPDHLFPETPLIRALEHDPASRLIPLIPGSDVHSDSPYGRIFYGATAMLFGLDSAGGYDNPPERIANLWRVVQGNAPEEVVTPRSEPSLRDLSDKAQRIWAFVPLFRVGDTRFDMLPRVGVTHVVSPPYVERDLTWPSEGLSATRLELVYDGADGRTYKVLDALPRAYMVPTCESVESAGAALERFAESGFDPRRAVVIESAFLRDSVSPCSSDGRDVTRENVGWAEVVGRSLNTLVVRTSGPSDGWLVVNESWDPGWKAKLDGAAVAVLPANYAFRGLRVPAGEHIVEFKYEPTTFVVGAVISGVILALITFLSAVWAIFRLRQHVVIRSTPWHSEPVRLYGVAIRSRIVAVFRLKLPTAVLAVALVRAAPRAWVVGYATLLVLLTAYHQWLGQRFSNDYFAGDQIDYLLPAGAIFMYMEPDLTHLLRSSSPVNSLFYGMMLRALDLSLIPHPNTIEISPGFGVALAMLATVLAVLVGAVAARYTGSWRAGTVAVGLAGLYAPFVIASERALAQVPLTVLLLLALLCLHEAIVQSSIVYGVATGFFSVLAVGSALESRQPLLILIFTSLLFVILLKVRRRDWLGARLIGSIFATAVIMCGAWNLFVWLDPPTDRRDLAQRALQQLPFTETLVEGWVPDSSYVRLAPSRASVSEGHLMPLPGTTTENCRAGAREPSDLVCSLFESPGDVLQRLAVTQYRLWWFPHNDFHVEVPPATTGLLVYHRLLVIGGLVGAFAAVGCRSASMMVVGPVLVSAVLVGIDQVTSRQALPAMPSLIVGSAALAVRLGAALPTAVREACRAKRRGRLAVFVIAFGGAGAAILFQARLSMASAASSTTEPLTLPLLVCVLFSVGLILFLSVLRRRRPVSSAAVALIGTLLVLGIVPEARLLSGQSAITLGSSQQRLLQWIVPKGNLDTSQSLAVILNVQAMDGDLSGLRVAVNNHQIPLRGPESGMLFITQNVTPAYYRWRYELSLGAKDALRLPQWVALPFPREWMVEGENQISVWLEEDGRPLPRVRVFGQPGGGDARRLAGPSLLQTSVGRYEHDGEARVPSILTLESMSRESLYSVDGGSSYATGLPFETAVQEGTYHVFLSTLTPKGDFETFEDSVEVFDVPQYSSVNGELDHPPSGSATDAFWFYATAPSTVRVALVDGTEPIMSFTPGHGQPHRWLSDRAEMAYSPSFYGTPVTALKAGLSPILTFAPTQIAAQQWYELQPVTSLSSHLPARHADSFGGAYVIRLNKPVVLRALRFVVMPPARQVPTSWEALLSQPFAYNYRVRASDAPERAVVRMETPDGTIQYLTATEAPTGNSEAGPRFFMVHGGDFQADVSVEEASSMLGMEAPSARLVPTTASNQIFDLTPHGRLVSSWTFPAPDVESIPRTSVRMSLD